MQPFPKRGKDNTGRAFSSRETSTRVAIINFPGSEKWPRPPLDAQHTIDPASTSIVFQQFDVTHIDTNDAFTGNQQRPVLRMFGCTNDGRSAMVHVHNFDPYFYTSCPLQFLDADSTAESVDLFHRTLELSVARNMPKNSEPCDRCICSVEIVDRMCIYGYTGDAMQKYLKIVTTLPGHVSKARSILEKGMIIDPFGPLEFKTFESNVPYVLRYMIDHGIVGGGWVECPAKTYRLRPHGLQVSRCQIECDISCDQLIARDPGNAEWSHMAPFRILSFDIECAGRPGCFPDPKIDPVIQIANVVTLQGSKEPLIKNVFVLDTCSSIIGSDVITFKTEEELLAAWRQFVITVDPDIIIGYNTSNFDIPYLVDRAETLRVSGFPYLGRIIKSRSTVTETTFSSKAFGTRKSKNTPIDGRVQLDMFQVIQRDHKLSSYTLNFVATKFLKDQKEDVHHSQISVLHAGSADDRRRLAVYCIKDAHLPQQLLDKLMIIYNYIEMARVTGVPVPFLLERGQQVKVISQMYRETRKVGMIVPCYEHVSANDGYEGATVIEPKRGFYDTPIATLDFASLYPSIMMAHNLCYSTLVTPERGRAMLVQDPDSVTHTPLGAYFVKPSVRQGLLPQILKNLLDARNKAKKEMKTAKDELTYAVLDGRQLALKISANSVYGFTGATVGHLPCMEISASVTAFGRQMIETTKNTVEATYTIANGYKADAVVIYGDTDSVMIKFGVDTVAEAMELGKQAAPLVSKQFIAPIKLEFEKIFYPYLLINKKRYAGGYWLNPDKMDRLDTKGIETVRRDNCALVRTVLNVCLRMILIDRKPQNAVAYAKDAIGRLVRGQVDLSELVVTKGYTKTAEEYAGKQGHIELAARMKKRDPGSAPNTGDRIPYVIIQGAKKAKMFEKTEDPIYVLEHNLPIDTEYYLEHQLKEPLKRIFTPILGETHVDELFQGEHMRAIKIATPASTGAGLGKFIKVLPACVRCKATIKTPELQKGIVCSDCAPHHAEESIKLTREHNQLEELSNRIWTNCQRCQGSYHQAVICNSRDCPMFYRRCKVQKDLTESAKHMARIQVAYELPVGLTNTTNAHTQSIALDW